MKNTRFTISFCAAMLAMSSVAWGGWVTNEVAITAKVEINPDPWSPFGENPDFVPDPVNPALGGRVVVNSALPMCSRVTYPLLFRTAYEPERIIRNNQADPLVLQMSLATKRGAGKFRSTAGVQEELDFACRVPTGYTLTWYGVSPTWSDWHDVYWLGWDFYFDLKSDEQNPFPPSAKVGDRFVAQDGIRGISLPIPSPAEVEEMVQELLQDVLTDIAADQGGASLSLTNLIDASNFRVHVGSMDLVSANGSGTPLGTNYAFFRLADGTLTNRIVFPNEHTWWGTNSVDPLPYTIVVTDPGQQDMLVTLRLNDVKFRFRFQQFFYSSSPPELAPLVAKCAQIMESYGTHWGIPLPEQEREVDAGSLIAAHLPLGLAPDLCVGTNVIVDPPLPIGRWLDTASPFRLTATVFNLGDTNAGNMTNSFRVTLTRAAQWPDIVFYETNLSGKATSVVYDTKRIGPLPGRGVTNVSFDLSANFGPDDRDSTNTFTRRFQLEVLSDEEDPARTNNNIAQFDVEFATAPDYYVELARDDSRTPFYRVGDVTWMAAAVNNGGYLNRAGTNYFWVNGTRVWHQATEKCAGFNVEFPWVPQKRGTNQLVFQYAVSDDAEPADNTTSLQVVVDPPRPETVGSIAGRVTHTHPGTGIEGARVVLVPDVAAYNDMNPYATNTAGMLSTATAGDGSYQIDDIPEGNYRAYYRAPVEQGGHYTNYLSETRAVWIGGETGPTNPVIVNVQLATLELAELEVRNDGLSVSPYPPLSSQANTLSVVFTNRGYSDATNVQVEFFEVNQQQAESPIGTNTVSAVPAGGMGTTSVSWRPGPNTNHLSNHIRVKINTDLLTEEFLYDNNTADQWFMVDDRPPTVTITAPANGAFCGSLIRTRWTASDPDGDPVSYILRVQPPGGSWMQLTALAGVQNFDWQTTAYADGSNYLFQVQASDEMGGIGSTNISLTIDNTKPVARLQVLSALPLTVNAECDFTGTNSTDNLSGVDRYFWAFGDGATSQWPSPSHFYSHPGTYTVRLTVTDKAGNAGSASTNVVLKARPEGQIDLVQPAPVYRGALVTMRGHGQDEDGQLAQYEWRSSLDGLLTNGPLSNAFASLTFNTRALQDGNHSLELRLQDNEGLWNDLPITHFLRVAMPPAWPGFRNDPAHVACAGPGILPQARPPMGNTYTQAWSYPTGQPVASSPAVANLDGDFSNGLEVVIGSADGWLYAFGSSGNLLWQYPSAQDPPLGAINSSPACVDTDGDGVTWEHVVFGSDNGSLYVLNSTNGSLVSQYTTPGRMPIQSSPVVADLDNDGHKEVVFGCNDGNLYCLSFPQAEFRWSYPMGIGGVISSPAIADLDGNPADGLEIVVGSLDGNVYALGAQGQLLWQFATGGPVESSPAIADVDGDGQLEVVVGGTDGHLYVIRRNGMLGAVYPSLGQPLGPIRSSPAVGDLYATPGVEIAVGSDDGNLYVLKYSPVPPESIILLHPFNFGLGAQVKSSSALAEIDPNPGRFPPGAPGFVDYSEIVVGVNLPGGGGRLVALSMLNNNPLWQFNTGPVTSSPAVAELNHAGELEIVFGSWDKSVYCLKTAYGADAGGSYTVNEGTPLLLCGTNSVGPPGRQLSYSWDLNGDGIFGDATNSCVTYTWNSNGEYLVSLLISDTNGYSDIAEARVAVLDLAPTACLNGPTNLNQGTAGIFYATNSTSSPDAIVEYEWDWNYNGLGFCGTNGGAVQTNTWLVPGTYTVALRVTDQDGSTSLATMTVQVLYVDPCASDNQPPVLTYPSALTVEQDSPEGASVQVVTNTIAGNLVMVDACDPAPQLLWPALPPVFAPGTTQVTFFGQDTMGNRSTGVVAVVVGDHLPPVLTCPSELAVEQTSPAGAAVALTTVLTGGGSNLLAFGAASVLAVDPAVTCPQVLVFGALETYPPGRTPVTFIASDAAGNSATGLVNVTVQDTTAPLVTILSPSNGLVLNYVAPVPVEFTVSDAGDANPSVMLRMDGRPVRSPIAPAGLGAGVHLVEVNALDRAGNAGSATSTFTLTARKLRVFAWGDNTFGQTNVPWALALESATTIAAGGRHSLALTEAGSVFAWGDNAFGQTNVPSGLAGVIALAGGGRHSLALDSSGKVTAWGANEAGQSSVPPQATPAMAIAAGSAHSLALRSDGTVVAWGTNSAGQTLVPSTLVNVVAIAAGHNHSVALTAGGQVVCWGDGSAGQTNVPTNLARVLAIAAGGDHTLALMPDGTIVAWGRNDFGQTNVPSGLSNIVAIAAGDRHSLALSGDGMVTSWGAPPAAPPGLANVAGIAANGLHSLALVGGVLPPVPPCLSAISWHDGVVELQVTTEPSRVFRLETSSDLVTWTPWITLTNLSGSMSCTGSNAWASPCFYRAVIPSIPAALPKR